MSASPPWYVSPAGTVLDMGIQELPASDREFITCQSFYDLILQKKESSANTECFFTSDHLFKVLHEIRDTRTFPSKEFIESVDTPFWDKYDAYHRGYFEYLYTAWNAHCGIVVAPWMLYAVFLYEFAKIVNEHENEFRCMFTSSNEKIQVVVESFDVSEFASTIEKFIPDPAVCEMFRPVWSDAPFKYDLVIACTFCQMVEKYYSVMVPLCGIPRVLVQGTEQDWAHLYTTVSTIASYVDSLGIHAADEFLQRVKTYTGFLAEHYSEVSTWKKFFYIEHCGSGSTEVRGHVFALHRDNYFCTPYWLSDGVIHTRGMKDATIANLPKQLSRFPFQFANYGEMVQCAGIIGSVLEDQILVPCFDNAIFGHKILLKSSEEEAFEKMAFDIVDGVLPLYDKINEWANVDPDEQSLLVDKFLSSGGFDDLTRVLVTLQKNSFIPPPENFCMRVVRSCDIKLVEALYLHVVSAEQPIETVDSFLDNLLNLFTWARNAQAKQKALAFWDLLAGEIQERLLELVYCRCASAELGLRKKPNYEATCKEKLKDLSVAKARLESVLKPLGSVSTDGIPCMISTSVQEIEPSHLPPATPCLGLPDDYNPFNDFVSSAHPIPDSLI